MATVLIVDDDARCREPVARMLRTDGYDVIRVANGREALAAMEEQSIQLIVLDQLMPEMDGLTFLEELRQVHDLTNVPVIMVSGMNDEPTMEKAAALGVKDFLIKSRFSITDLREQIKWHLGSGQNEAAVNSGATCI
jgi:DNA-binding response OmpR family regulator